MKVIHCLNHFLPTQIAGTEVYVWALCKQLQALGCEVKVVIPHYHSAKPADYVYDGLPVHQYGEPSVVDRDLISGKRVADGIQNFERYLHAEKPDVIHFHEIAGSSGIGVAHLEVAQRTGAKVVFTIHLSGITCHTGTLMYENKTICDGLMQEKKCGYCALVRRTGVPKAKLLSMVAQPFHRLGINLRSINHPLGTALSFPFVIGKLKQDLKRIENACDLLIPITNWYAEILMKNGVSKKKLKVIQQGLPFDAGVPVKTAVSAAGPLKLIFLGRIDELKGISLLLKAMMEVLPTEAELDIYGSGPDKSFVEECLKLTANYSHIRWKGRLNQDEVLCTLQKYDALVLPSMFSEMSPLVIQEAFAAGIPVIGSNVYGIAEQIEEGINGFLFEFGNKESLKSLLASLIANPSLIEAIRERKPNQRMFQDVAAETIKAYRSMIYQSEMQI